MQIKQRLLFFLIAASVFLAPLAASATAPLSLDQCLERAMRDNRQIKAYQSAVDEAQAGIGEARGAFLPTLTLSYDKSEVLNSAGTGTDPDFIDQQSERFSVRLSQPLFAGLSSVAGLKKARQNRVFRERELQYVMAQVARDVRSVFYDLLMAEQLVVKRVESIERLEQQTRIAQAWVDQSLAPRIHLLEVQVVLSNAKQDLLAAETSLTIARARLEDLLAVESGLSIDIAGSLQQGGSEACTEVADCLSIALQQRPEPELLALNIAMAQQDIKAIAARNLPRASLDASWIDYQRDYESALRPDDDQDYYSVMLNLSMQPFQGSRTFYAWKKQRASIDRLEHLLVRQKNTIVTEVRSGFAQLQESYGRLEAATDSLTQARQAYQLMTRSVELGVSSLRDLLDSATLLTRAEINMINSHHALQLSRIQLDYVVGKGF